VITRIFYASLFDGNSRLEFGNRVDVRVSSVLENRRLEKYKFFGITPMTV
jgi:hypothetical protein